MAKNVLKTALLAAAAFMLAFLPACSNDDEILAYKNSAVAVTGVTVSADKTTLYVSGEDTSTTLTANVKPDNATDKTVTWLSSDSTVAAISPETGGETTVTARAAGVATVTATASGKVDSVQLTVFADKASQAMFQNIAGVYVLGGTSVNIDRVGFVTMNGKKSDKPAVVNGSTLTVTIENTNHTITVAGDGSLTLDGAALEQIKIALTMPNGVSSERDTIKDALAAIPADDDGTYTITLRPATYNEDGLSYKGSATIVIAGNTDAKYGSDVVIAGKGSSQLDSKSRCLLYVDGTANIVLKNVTLQNTLNRSDPDIPKDSKGNPLTQAEAFGFGSSGTVTAYNSSFLSHQDTVRTVGKAWFYQCYFEGDVDFLWMETSGQVALYEKCEIKMVGDETNKAYVAAPGLAQTSPVGKGLVIYNSKVIVDDRVDGYLARTPWTDGKYNQVAYINTTVEGSLKDVWYGAPIATEFPKTDIGWKLDGTTAAALGHAGNDDVLSARMTAREYNGRYVILNRVFDTKANQYTTAATQWDAAAVLGIGDDASKNNIFLDYADVTKTSVGDELVVTDFDGPATGVTWSVRAFSAYENGELSGEVNDVTIDSTTGAITNNHSGNVYVEVTATKGGARDSIILYNVTATAISLSQTEVSIAEGSDVTLTATFEPEGADAEVVWTSSDDTVASVDGGKVVAKAGKAGSTATITATIKDTELKATCTVTVTAAVVLKKFGTSVAGVSTTDYNKIGTNEYLLYPVPITVGEAYAIEAQITYTSVANIGVGIVAFKDGAYSDGVVSRVAFATPAGIKSSAGGQGYNASNTESDGVYIVKAYTKKDSEYLFFSLTTPNGVELTKDSAMSYYVPAQTDTIYLAIGGTSNSGASVSANDVTITVGDAAPAKVAMFDDLAADARTALSVSGSVSYTIAATETSAKGTKFTIPLTEDMLSGLSVSPTATGAWSWDTATVETPDGGNIAAKATFIPADRTQYKAVLSHEVYITVTDERASSNATFLTIKCFESNGTIANATATGGDSKITASAVTYVGLDIDSSNAQRFASVGSANGTKDLAKFYYVKLTVDGSVSAKLTAFEGKGSHAGSTNNLTIEYYLANSLPSELSDDVVKNWTPLGKATRRQNDGSAAFAKFSTETPISGDVYIVAFPSAQASALVGPGPMTIDVSYE